MVQNLGNLQVFGMKEPYMSDMNIYIEQKLLDVKLFLTGASMPNKKLRTKADDSIDFALQGSRMYRFLRKVNYNIQAMYKKVVV